jgi:hypothetical protein
LDSESATALRTEITALRCDISNIRQDVSMLETKADSLEAWRVRYLVQEDHLINKLFNKVDELVAGLSDVRVELSRVRGERDAERRTSLMIVSLLSAACGGLVASFFHGG